MSKSVRLLLVEDNNLDAAHFTMAMRRGGFDPHVRRVETREEMLDALATEEWDIVVSDYHLPQFSAPEALETLRQSNRDLPFIVVSGAVGEETAVELMRAGASDYLLKHRLTRLTAAIERELAQAKERTAKRRAEDLFYAVLRSAPQPSVIVDRVTYAVVDGSDAFRRSFPQASGAATLFDAIEFTTPERVVALLARGTGSSLNTVYYLGGVAHVANLRCHTVDHKGASYAYLVIEDVTEQNYLKAAFDAVPDPLLIVSPRHTLLYANRPAEEALGELYFDADVTALLAREGMEDHWWKERTLRGEEARIDIAGQVFEASSVPFRFAGETDTSTILTLRNVSQEEELLRLATHDSLTGIHNVRYFNEALARTLETGGGILALLDLDFFKPINDQLGHAAGDAALITFASTVRSLLRPNDLFARLGGDEFGILFSDSSVETVRSVLDGVYANLTTNPFRFSDASLHLSASGGLAASAPGESAQQLKERADRALYEAKRQGKGRYVEG
jgi:diguanylate cyclase (GGDEF)-like protein